MFRQSGFDCTDEQLNERLSSNTFVGILNQNTFLLFYTMYIPIFQHMPSFYQKAMSLFQLFSMS